MPDPKKDPWDIDDDKLPEGSPLDEVDSDDSADDPVGEDDTEADPVDADGETFP